MTSCSILEGDCLDKLAEIPDDSVHFILTSPPYGQQRKSTYGGIHPDNYVEWFLPRAEEFKRVLRPDGTFILNIKENVVDGERHTYVLQLIQSLREAGWLWTEEFIWHKKNTAPGKWPNRFRDTWERCLQFNLQRKFKMFQDTVRVPMGDWSKSRLKKLSEKDRTRQNSQVGSGFGKDLSKWEGRELAYPTNVLYMATECGNKGHGAVFPLGLPWWFISLFTEAGDTVLDPFSGSGTTGVAARLLDRDYIGVEILPENCELSTMRWENAFEEKDFETPSRPETKEAEDTSGDDPLEEGGLGAVFSGEGGLT